VALTRRAWKDEAEGVDPCECGRADLGREEDEMSAMTPHDEELRTLAVKRLKKKSDFRGHVVVYVLVNTFLVVIWAMSGAGYFWPAFVLGGWGIGLVANAWDVYGRSDVWTEDQIHDEMRRLDRRR
jgi:hypothetical protein